MIRRLVTRATKLLVYGVVGVAGYTVVNNNPKEQFRKPEIKQVISKEPYRVQLLLHLPLNSLSRLWGKVSNVEVPSFCRTFLYSAYISLYKCDVTEAQNEDLKSYKCFGDFFTRSLKEELRPISLHTPIVSPSDGVVLSLGRVEACQVCHVKDKDYNLQFFIGPKSWHLSSPEHLNNSLGDGLFSRLSSVFGDFFSNENYDKINLSNKTKSSLSSPPSPQSSSSSSFQFPCDSYPNSLKCSPQNNLYHCTIYLAPGDYHRFHSPADWECKFRRHFPGYLLSVSPKMADRMPELMNANERVVYVGEWKHGFITMVMVGATNVGSIKVYNDPSLLTNAKASLPPMIDNHFNEHSSKSLSPSSSSPPLPRITPPTLNATSLTPDQTPQLPASLFLHNMTFKKGDPFGQFNLGSTIVLVFEAPPSFQFCSQIGDKLKYGQALGRGV